MSSLRAFAAVAIAGLFAVSCLTEGRAFLAFEIDNPCSAGLQPGCPPDSTSATSITIGGRVVRSPPSLDLAIQVQAVNEADTTRATANAGGFFALSVPLRRNETNEIVLTADDGTESTTERNTFLIVHDEQIPGVSRPPIERR